MSNAMDASVVNVQTHINPLVEVNSQEAEAISTLQSVIADFVIAKKRYTFNDLRLAMAKRGWAFMRMIDDTVLIVRSGS